MKEQYLKYLKANGLTSKDLSFSDWKHTEYYMSR